MDDFRVKLMTLAENLDKEELKKLKFACTGKVSKQRSENATSIEMMELLEQNGLVSRDNCTFLADFLHTVHRGDLLQLLPGFIEPPTLPPSESLPFPEQERPQNNQDDEMRRILSNVAKRIIKEWKMVARVLRVSDDDIHCIVHDYNSSILEQAYQGLFKWYSLNRHKTSVDLLESLAAVLENRGRKDIADDIRDHQI
uniref:FAS-associated death domain protein-like n=1 Tax=Myxine glutinosa TaxID=7769 RepID=UPI00358E73F5